MEIKILKVNCKADSVLRPKPVLIRFCNMFNISVHFCPCKLVKCNQRTQGRISRDRLLVFDLKTAAAAAISTYFGVSLINIHTRESCGKTCGC